MLTKKQLYAQKRYKEKRDFLILQATAYYIKNRKKINERKAQKRRIDGNIKSVYKKRVYSYISIGKRVFLDNKELKKRILDIYGNYCVCCNEKNIVFLTIDHINNDGYKEKDASGRKIKAHALYRKILQEEKRKDIQILCFNCNIGRRNNGGNCPHKSENPKA